MDGETLLRYGRKAEAGGGNRERLQRMWQSNTRLLASSQPIDSHQSPLSLVSDAVSAKRELLHHALTWTAQYADVSGWDVSRRNVMGGADIAAGPDLRVAWQSSEPVVADSPRIFLSGHQPELFHPGVWYKNFVLNQSALASDSLPINLVIDNDLIKSNAITIPVSEGSRLKKGRVNFDFGGLGLPFEMRGVQRWDLMQSLPQRLRQKLASGREPGLLEQVWPDVIEVARLTRRLGYGFAAARHRSELRAGTFNLEVPLSVVCQSRWFFEFLVAVLERLELFHETYNQVLNEYRELNQIKGQERPVPDLQKTDDWFELPFWLWTDQAPNRARLFARRKTNRRGDTWQIRDQMSAHSNSSPANSSPANLSAANPSPVMRGQSLVDLELSPANAVDQLMQASQEGLCLRTRALTTTMYCRAVLSHAFLHGIGGAIYDQLTDEIACRFFGVRLPQFQIASATLHLPVPVNGDSPGGPEVANRKPTTSEPEEMSTAQKLRQARRNLRRGWFQPETLAAEKEAAAEEDFRPWVARKLELLAEIPPRGQKKVWHEQLEQANRNLRRLFAAEIEDARVNEQELKLELDNQQMNRNREWSFLLFSAALPQRLQDLAKLESSVS